MKIAFIFATLMVFVKSTTDSAGVDEPSNKTIVAKISDKYNQPTSLLSDGSKIRLRFACDDCTVADIRDPNGEVVWNMPNRKRADYTILINHKTILGNYTCRFNDSTELRYHLTYRLCGHPDDEPHSQVSQCDAFNESSVCVITESFPNGTLCSSALTEEMCSSVHQFRSDYDQFKICSINGPTIFDSLCHAIVHFRLNATIMPTMEVLDISMCSTDETAELKRFNNLSCDALNFDKTFSSYFKKPIMTPRLRTSFEQTVCFVCQPILTVDVTFSYTHQKVKDKLTCKKARMYSKTYNFHTISREKSISRRLDLTIRKDNSNRTLKFIRRFQFIDAFIMVNPKIEASGDCSSGLHLVCSNLNEFNDDFRIQYNWTLNGEPLTSAIAHDDVSAVDVKEHGLYQCTIVIKYYGIYRNEKVFDQKTVNYSVPASCKNSSDMLYKEQLKNTPKAEEDSIMIHVVISVSGVIFSVIVGATVYFCFTMRRRRKERGVTTTSATGSSTFGT